jgi:hypothetical protein
MHCVHQPTPAGGLLQLYCRVFVCLHFFYFAFVLGVPYFFGAPTLPSSTCCGCGCGVYVVLLMNADGRVWNNA